MRGERVDVEGGGGGGKRDQPSREGRGHYRPSRLESASAWIRLDRRYGAEGGGVRADGSVGCGFESTSAPDAAETATVVWACPTQHTLDCL